MTIYFDINAGYSEIMATLAAAPKTDITVCYDTGEKDFFNTARENLTDIAYAVNGHLNAIRDDLDSMLREQDMLTDSNDDKMYDIMYQTYLAEMECRYDTEDAVLHHCA